MSILLFQNIVILLIIVTVSTGVKRKAQMSYVHIMGHMTFVSLHHHNIRFSYLRCCGCPGLRGGQHLATPHTRSP